MIMVVFEPIKGYNWLMMKYNWQKPDWPNFTYDLTSLHEDLLAISEKAGLLRGKLAHLDENLQTEAFIDLMMEEAIKTSEIEGEYINRLDIRSSIKNKLNLASETIKIHDKRADGIVEMLYDARKTFNAPLTNVALFDWHLMLASGFSATTRIGSWRIHEEPMQIISGHYGKRTVHYEAPPSKDVPNEMERFIQWFNETAPGNLLAIKFAPVRAAIAHLYFESIHPFEDGNGRIGRVIAEKALAQGFGYPLMFSLSPTIEANKKVYYEALHIVSRTNEITNWIHYFVTTIFTAQCEVEKQINFILYKAKFFDKYKNALNERQLKVVKRIFKAGIKGFEGGMTTKKYMVITGTSKATATRDLQDLQEIQAFIQFGRGRGVYYELAPKISSL